MSSVIKIFLGVFFLLLISCNNKEQKSAGKNDFTNITLLTQKTIQSEHMQGLLSSEPEKLLVDENGCIRIKNYLIVWPHGFKVINRNNNMAIVNNEGEVVANIGDRVTVSGGECSGCSLDDIKKVTGTDPNPQCEGIYWIVGNEIKRK